MIKDSWQRKEFSNWFVRDVDTNKLRWDLLPIEILERVCTQYTEWMNKYWANNWQQARWKEAIERFKQSARRHFISWQKWEYDENHDAATIFNIMAYERHRKRMLDNDATFDHNWEEFYNIYPKDL